MQWIAAGSQRHRGQVRHRQHPIEVDRLFKVDGVGIPRDWRVGSEARSPALNRRTSSRWLDGSPRLNCSTWHARSTAASTCARVLEPPPGRTADHWRTPPEPGARRRRRHSRCGRLRHPAEHGRFSADGTPSGSFATIDPDESRRRGITLTAIADLQHRPGDRPRLLAAVLAELTAGRLAPVVGQTYPLTHAAKAHQALALRETIAKTLLLPDR